MELNALAVHTYIRYVAARFYNHLTKFKGCRNTDCLDGNINTLSSDATGSTTSYRTTFGGTSGASPIITGAAYVNAEATLLLDEQDPFCWGIR